MNRKFGIEIETDGTISKKNIFLNLKKITNNITFSGYQLSDGSCWHIKDDITCGCKNKKGVEIVSPICQFYIDIQTIKDICETLNTLNCKVNEDCGLHIHADATDLTEKNVSTILSYWIKIEDSISKILPSFRLNNKFCRPTYEYFHNFVLERSKRWPAEIIWDTLKPRKHAFAENEDRRVNLNVVNYSRAIKNNTDKRKTIELRWPESSLDFNDIIGWIKLYLSFIDICKNLKMPSNLEVFTIEETLNFLNLDKETKLWFNNRIKKFSIKTGII